MSIGTKIVLEGEKEYRSAIYNVNKSIGTLKSEMRAATAEFDGNANSVDALRKKNEILAKQQKEQEKAIQLLRGALESATKAYGENSNQALDWQRKLNNAEAQLSKLNKEIGSNDKYLKEAKASTDKTAKSIDEFGKEVKEASDDTKIFGDVLKANLLSDALYDGVRKLGSLMVDMIKDSKDLASDLLEVQNVVDVTFGDDADNIDKWAETIGEAFGLSELKGKQFVGTIGAMLKSMQVTDEQALEMSKTLSQLAGDMASFYNIDVDSAFAKIRSGISGETEPLKQLGVNLNVANLEAYALAQGIEKAYSEMSQAEQVILRTNYLLKVTADAQGDFTRNLDSQANQERITQLQREELLKRFGEAVLPAVTRATMKFNEATKDMGGDLAKVAGVLADDVVDVLVWIIDNADTVIAGLKGIAAAVIAKKAADGALFLVNAYKTLTTTTQAATVAQEGFNTASKANIYVAIASAVIGISTALFSFVKNANDASDEMYRLNSESIKLIENSKKLNEEIESSKKKRLEERDAIIAQGEGAKQLAESLYELADKEKKTSEEKEQMLALTKQLNDMIPNLNLVIDEQTGLLNLNKDAISGLIDKQLEYNMVMAAQDDIGRIATEKYNAEKDLSELLEDQVKLEKERAEAQEKYLRESQLASPTAFSMNFSLKDADKAYTRAKEVYEKNTKAIDSTRELIKGLDEDYKYVLDYIGQHAAGYNLAENALDSFSVKYQKVLDEQTQAETGTIEDRQKQISKIYEQTSKELDKQLKAEERAFTKSQQKRVEEVQKAQEQELKELEKTQKIKLDLLNEEYLQKIKAVDEDRYNEIKKIQDEIDDINNQQEAEDRALKTREDAEKKAELQSRVESATTIEERMDAQNELQKHEERVAKERLKEERALQKDILKEQKDTINKSFDEKVKVIEAEQKKEQEKLSEQLKSEKEAVTERYKLKLEALKEEQELEKDAFRDRQTEYKDYLREQRELAVANSKEIYEEDLAKFKMNQALKLEEVTSSEEQMKKAILDYANKIMLHGDVTTGKAIMNSDSLEEMLKYYNPTGMINSSVPQATTINYSMIEDSMSRAVKKLNLTVNVNNKVLGEIVDEHIRRNLRR